MKINKELVDIAVNGNGLLREQAILLITDLLERIRISELTDNEIERLFDVHRDPHNPYHRQRKENSESA